MFAVAAGGGDSGAASIRLNDSGTVVFCSRLTWPESFLIQAVDSSGRTYGCKTTTLEIVAMILPFLTEPTTLASRHVVLQVDNAATVYGWHRRHVSHDASASILRRALHLISSYLACYIHVVHVPRVSTHAAFLADALSQVSSSTPRVIRAISHASLPAPPAILLTWLSSPTEDWNFAVALLHHVQSLHHT